MANHHEVDGDYAVQQRAEVQNENDGRAVKKVEEGARRRTDDEEVRLRWPWLKHRASVVAAFCFVTVLTLTVLLPLLLVPSARSGTDEVWNFLRRNQFEPPSQLHSISCSDLRTGSIILLTVPRFSVW